MPKPPSKALAKFIGVFVEPEVAEKFDAIARRQHRNRSAQLRHMLARAVSEPNFFTKGD